MASFTEVRGTWLDDQVEGASQVIVYVQQEKQHAAVVHRLFGLTQKKEIHVIVEGQCDLVECKRMFSPCTVWTGFGYREDIHRPSDVVNTLSFIFSMKGSLHVALRRPLEFIHYGLKPEVTTLRTHKIVLVGEECVEDRIANLIEKHVNVFLIAKDSVQHAFRAQSTAHYKFVVQGTDLIKVEF